MISAVVQTSIRHGKSTFFKICITRKVWGIKLPFTSKNPFVIWSFHAKVMDKFQIRGKKCLNFECFWTFNVFWTLIITFEWRLQITNGFFEVNANLIFYKSLVEFNFRGGHSLEGFCNHMRTNVGCHLFLQGKNLM
jgi:hypothetical protein